MSLDRLQKIISRFRAEVGASSFEARRELPSNAETFWELLESMLRARYLDLTNQELVHLELVGNYALAPTWADGHNTGIYSFRLLRGLCPCDDCGGERR